MEVLGHATCQPLGACGEGTWGELEVGPSTLFVDQAYAGGDSDGSQARPYTTINEALKKASVGAQIAVAAGTYAEDVHVKTAKLRLEGRCAELVTIKGQQQNPHGAIEVDATDLSLRGVTVTGPWDCVFVTAGSSVTLDEVAVIACGNGGLLGINGARIVARDTLVSRARAGGVAVVGSTLELRRVVVRDTRPQAADQAQGIGVQLLAGAKATIRDTLIASNRYVGLSVLSAAATVERSVVRETRPQATDLDYGNGIVAGPMTELQQPGRPSLTVRDCVLAGNRELALGLVSADAVVERTIIRDTRPGALGPVAGFGILAQWAPTSKAGTKLTLRGSALLRNRAVGLELESSSAVVEDSVIEETLPDALDQRFGQGVRAIHQILGQQAGPAPRLTLRRSRVARHGTGVVLVGATGTVEKSVVRGPDQPGPGFNMGGVLALNDYVNQKGPSTLTLRDALVTNNLERGVWIEGSKATVERARVVGTRSPLASSPAKAGITAMDDLRVASGSVALTLRDSVVADNKSWAGVQVMGRFTATLTGVVVRDTEHGIGIEGSSFGLPSRLTVRRSLVQRSRVAGIASFADLTTIEQTAVLDTRAEATGGWGDGIGISYWSTTKRPRLDIRSVLVRRFARAGLMAYDATGRVERSVFSDGKYAVALEEGADPTLGSSNLFVDNAHDTIVYGRRLKRLPPPPVPEPFSWETK
jgi:hypothetical protein